RIAGTFEPNPCRSGHQQCHRRRAYDTRKCHEAIAARDAHAMIPQKPRRNETSRDHAAHNPAGQWMHCMKLLGQSLMARDFERQVAETLVRIAEPLHCSWYTRH
ncbi:MAG: hypothetical protein ACI9BH_001790, partial [Paracoccaceae bacterium]